MAVFHVFHAISVRVASQGSLWTSKLLSVWKTVAMEGSSLSSVMMEITLTETGVLMTVRLKSEVSVPEVRLNPWMSVARIALTKSTFYPLDKLICSER